MLLKKINNVANDLVKLLNEEYEGKIRGAAQKLNSMFSKIQNKGDIPSILLFDFWISNIDRFTNSGNIILKLNDTGNYVIAIDFGHCFFGPCWDKSTKDNFSYIIDAVKKGKIRQASADLTKYYLDISKSHSQSRWKLGIMFDHLQKQIIFDNGNPFQQIELKIKQINNNQIASMMTNIPNSWVIGGDSQRSSYLQYGRL